MQIGVVFGTTTIDPVTQAFLVEAWDRQSRGVLQGVGHPLRARGPLRHDPRRSDVTSGEIRVMMVEDTIDVPDALGYHTDELGLIFARILAENNAESGSHECLRGDLDPTAPSGSRCPTAARSPSRLRPGRGRPLPQDATIGDTTRQIPVSNYVLPELLRSERPAPLRPHGQAQAPFTMTDGGYMAVRDAAGNESDVFADRKPRVEHGGERGRMAAMKKRARPDSRLSRRLAAPKYRSEASSPPMPWGPGPRPEGWTETTSRRSSRRWATERPAATRAGAELDRRASRRPAATTSRASASRRRAAGRSSLRRARRRACGGRLDRSSRPWSGPRECLRAVGERAPVLVLGEVVDADGDGVAQAARRRA